MNLAQGTHFSCQKNTNRGWRQTTLCRLAKRVRLSASDLWQFYSLLLCVATSPLLQTDWPISGLKTQTMVDDSHIKEVEMVHADWWPLPALFNASWCGPTRPVTNIAALNYRQRMKYDTDRKRRRSKWMPWSWLFMSPVNQSSSWLVHQINKFFGAWLDGQEARQDARVVWLCRRLLHTQSCTKNQGESTRSVSQQKALALHRLFRVLLYMHISIYHISIGNFES